MHKTKLDTPCLIIDFDVMNRNIRDMAEFARDAKIFLRPMIKTHKCPAIAHLQLKAPVTPGINATKVGEAEVFAATGIDDIFLTNEIIGESKVEKLVNLAKHLKIRAGVDSIIGVQGLDAVAKKYHITLDVLIHVDTGNKRTGVLPGVPALQLALKVLECDSLVFKGIWTHEGQNYCGRNQEEIAQITLKAGEDMVNTKELIEKETGKEVYVSVGSTPGAKLLGKMPSIDEIRPGAYVFNDGSQVALGACKIEDCACSVLSTVISTPEPNRIVCDAGTKAAPPPALWMAFDQNGCFINGPCPSFGGGIIKGVDGEIYDKMVFHRWGEEYGMIEIQGKKPSIRIGDKIEIVPYHVCDTVNLYDEFFVIRNNELEAVWPILARGKVR